MYNAEFKMILYCRSGPGGGSGDKDKWMILGAIGVIGLFWTLSSIELRYKEINWKDFCNQLVLCHFTCELIQELF